MTPASSYIDQQLYGQILDRSRQMLQDDGLKGIPNLPAEVRRFQWVTREAISPLEYLINALHPWVAFVIMPLFAFANAGVPVRLTDIASPVSLAVVLGLAIGKPLGVVSACWLVVRCRLASLPTGVNWRVMCGAGCLAGIGFTMALFIAGLALQNALLDMAKIGVLAGSFLSAVVGVILLHLTLPRAPANN